MPMRLSVVVATRNRPDQIGRSIRALLSLESPEPWELVIVDNGSTIQSCAGIIASELALAQNAVRAVYEPRRGSGAARNAGWRASQGEFVAFTDDDCIPAPDYLLNILACFDESPHLGFIGGRILLYDPDDYPITIQEKATRHDLPPRTFLRPGLIQGANMACRRTALESVGGFDVRFGAGTPFSCEDVDLLARMLGKGWSGAYDPRPVIHHHHGRKAGEAVDTLARSYDSGRGAYYAKSSLDPALRWTYLRHWLRAMRHLPTKTTARELAGAFRYLIQSFEFWLSRVVRGQ